MNLFVGMGRLTDNPDVRYSTGNPPQAVARYTLAIDRRFKKDGQQETDFINCVAFGKTAEFAEKYFHKGIKILVQGEVRTGSYTNREGRKVYTTDIVVSNQEFAESKKSQEKSRESKPQADPKDNDDFMDLPDDTDLPFL